MEKRLETKQVKLTKETLKRIIKEELENLILEAGFRPISPEEQAAQDSQEAKEREERENEIIRKVIGSGQKLAFEMSKEFEKAFKGGDFNNPSDEQTEIQNKYFHKDHAKKEMNKWWYDNLQNPQAKEEERVSYSRKKQVLSFLNPRDGGKLSAIWSDLLDLDLSKPQTPLSDIISTAVNHRSEGLAKTYPGIDG